MKKTKYGLLSLGLFPEETRKRDLLIGLIAFGAGLLINWLILNPAIADASVYRGRSNSAAALLEALHCIIGIVSHAGLLTALLAFFLPIIRKHIFVKLHESNQEILTECRDSLILGFYVNILAWRITGLAGRSIVGIIICGILAFLLFVAVLVLCDVSLIVASVKVEKNREGIYSDSLGMQILLSICTCGFYNWLWTFRYIKNMRIMEQDSRPCLGEWGCMLFVPLYPIYWYHVNAQRLHLAARDRGLEVMDRGTMFMVLSILGLSTVAHYIMQNDFNDLNDGACRPAVAAPAAPAAPEQAASAQPSSDASLAMLEQLAALHGQGVLTDEEFLQKKADILSRL